MPAAPVSPVPSGPHVLWQLGFRPFFLLAGAYASLSIALWGARYAGWLPGQGAIGAAWHAHEMLFGFTMAVLTGFLFTAVRNWTALPTPRGGWLIAIAILWIAGRVAVLTPFTAMSMVLNTAFPLAVAIGIAVPLLRSGNRRNYFFVGLLAVIALAVLGVHLVPLIDRQLPARIGVRTALDVMLVILAVMGGRVIPMFTTNGVPGTAPRRHPVVERTAIGSLIVLAIVDVLPLEGTPLVAITVATLGVAAVGHAIRWWLWQPHRTLRVPLVWVLHAAYVWIPIHLLLRAAGDLGVLAAPLATHALTAGAIGGLTIGMMTRTSKGHTGRALTADAADTACYLLVLGAAVVRVFGPLLFPDAYVTCVLVAAIGWTAGFGLFTLRYAGPLTSPRVDGRPG